MGSDSYDRMFLKEIQGAALLRSDRFIDDRGVFCSGKLSKLFTICMVPLLQTSQIEVNTVINSTLVRRGLHFQKKSPQAKWITVLHGSIVDVVLDLREDSPTFKKVFQIVLDASMTKTFFIPRGCAHGYQTLSHGTIVQYVTDEAYVPSDQYGVNALDPILEIRWPRDKVSVSGKDKALPLLDDYLKNQW